MSWQIIMILQIFIASLVMLFWRYLAVSDKKHFFTIGVFSFFGIALAGAIYAIIANHGLPALPSAKGWAFVLIEGLFIPIGWFFQYKLLAYIGASNTTLVMTFSTINVALLGILFLGESLTLAFIGGVLFVLASVYIALLIEPDLTHHPKVEFKTKALIALGAFGFSGIGIFFEKLAVDQISVWHYSLYGWGMQFMGALAIFLLFGRHEIAIINKAAIKSGLMLGLATSVAGGLYILALSKGTLSHTVVATSGRVAVTMLLSAIILKERNQLSLRLTAFALSTIGVALILF